MSGTNFFRILMVIVLIAVIVGAGVYVYNIGLMQGRAEGAFISGQEPGELAYPPYWYWHGFRPFGSGFSLISLFFLLFFLFFLTRILFWRPRWGWGGHSYGEGKDVPRRFEEWHQRLHEQDQEGQ